MTENDRELDALVRTFVGNLRALFQKQMRAAFDDAIGAATREVRPAAEPKPVVKATKPTPAAKPARAAAGGRRSAAEIEKTIARVKDFVSAHPGSRMEHIGAGLGLATKILTGPVAKLLAAGDIRREGERRATKYFPGGAVEAPKASSTPSAKGGSKSKAKAKKASGKQGANAAAAG